MNVHLALHRRYTGETPSMQYIHPHICLSGNASSNASGNAIQQCMSCCNLCVCSSAGSGNPSGSLPGCPAHRSVCASGNLVAHLAIWQSICSAAYLLRLQSACLLSNLSGNLSGHLPVLQAVVPFLVHRFICSPSVICRRCVKLFISAGSGLQAKYQSICLLACSSVLQVLHTCHTAWLFSQAFHRLFSNKPFRRSRKSSKRSQILKINKISTHFFHSRQIKKNSGVSSSASAQEVLSNAFCSSGILEKTQSSNPKSISPAARLQTGTHISCSGILERTSKLNQNQKIFSKFLNIKNMSQIS
jgi:hypothetical protein